MIPSKYQSKIYDWFQDGEGDLLTNAVAGSGKTTTLVKAVEFIPKQDSAIFLAFNKSIVKELRHRLPSHIQCKTLHSLGWSAIKDKFPKANLDANRLKRIINNLARNNWKLDKDEWDQTCGRILKLCDLSRLNLVKKQQDVYDLADKHGLEMEDTDFNRIKQVLTIALSDNLEYDFTDMLFIPARFDGFRLPKYKWILVDEAQDLNIAQQMLVEKLRMDGSRVIYVGDPRQAIYGFCGADTESFKNLGKRDNVTELPLSICYRCPKSVIKLAQTIVPEIEARPDAPEGEVRDGSIKELREGDFVLCRNTAPLVKLCLELISQKRNAYVKGIDIGANLSNMVKKTKAQNFGMMWKVFSNEAEKLFNRIKRENPHMSKKDIIESSGYQLLMNKYDVFRVIIDNHAGVKTPDDLVNTIKSIFKDDAKGICLSTIHKSKGLEADNVFIIDRWLMPAFYAKQDWEKEQEQNLMYVAYTRAKNKLVFVTDWTSKNNKDEESAETKIRDIQQGN